MLQIRNEFISWGRIYIDDKILFFRQTNKNYSKSEKKVVY